MNADIDISSVSLKTKRLLLRPFRREDLHDFYEYAKVDGVGEMAGWRHHESIETTKIILEDFIKTKKTFAIVYKDKVIGSFGIEKYDEEEFKEFNDLKCREIGYVLSKDYWGKGLMPEAVTSVCDYLFSCVGLDLILCAYFDFNERSRRVIEKCGFKYYKEYMRTEMGNEYLCVMNTLEHR